MAKYYLSSVALLTIMIASVGSATAKTHYNRDVIGIFGGVGLGGATRSEDIDSVDISPRLTGVGELHYNHFFNRHVGINIGAGIISKGYSARFEDGYAEIDGVVQFIDAHDSWYKSVHAVVPVGAVFNFGPLRLGIDVMFNYTLSARMVDEIDGSRKSRYVEGEDWDQYRRFNFGPRVTAGVRIPVSKSGALVAAAFFETNILNSNKENDSNDNIDIENTSVSERFWNLMVTVGYEFGL